MLTYFLIGLGVLLTLFIFPWLLVELRAGGLVSADPNAFGSRDTVVVLGCPPRVRSGAANPYFVRRMDACASLYRAGGVRRIILSGAVLSGLDEPGAMASELVARGVPAELLEQDPLALRTLASVMRSKEVYGVRRAVVVSQRFHNLRTLTLARAAGLDWVGLNAHDPIKAGWLTKWFREGFSRLRMLWDILTIVFPRS